MENKIILMLILYAHLIFLGNLNANAMEDIREKSKKIKNANGKTSFFEATDGQKCKTSHIS